MKNNRYCPNCIAEMALQKRMSKLGKPRECYVCPDCGVRETTQEQETQFIDTENNGEPEYGYYDCSEDNIIYDYIQQKDPS